MWRPDQLYISDTDLALCGEDKRYQIAAALKCHEPIVHHVSIPFSELYPDQNQTDANLTQLLYGEPFEVHHTEGKMSYGKSQLDGYVGWIASDALQAGYCEPTHLVALSSAPLYEKPYLKQTPVLRLPAAAFVTATGMSENGYIELDCGRWLFENHVIMQPTNSDNLVGNALNFMATPYVWGGRTAGGIDCSGLVQIALSMMGLRCHRDSDMQFNTLGRRVERDELTAGDIAFFPGHVGIMVDAENILHANATHMAVTIDPLDDVIGWVAKETEREPFLGGKRL